MWKSRLFLWLFPILAGITLGTLVYSYLVWTTDFPFIFIGYWFGVSNFTLVFTVTTVILLAYTLFLIVGLINKKNNRKIKIWIVFGMLAIAGLSTFTLLFSQPIDRMDRLDIEMEREQSTHSPDINHWY